MFFLVRVLLEAARGGGLARRIRRFSAGVRRRRGWRGSHCSIGGRGTAWRHGMPPPPVLVASDSRACGGWLLALRASCLGRRRRGCSVPLRRFPGMYVSTAGPLPHRCCWYQTALGEEKEKGFAWVGSVGLLLRAPGGVLDLDADRVIRISIDLVKMLFLFSLHPLHMHAWPCFPCGCIFFMLI